MFGRARTTPYQVEQSLFLVRNQYLCDFTKDYLALPESDDKSLTEEKFLRLERNNPNSIGRFDFGYGRDRPFDINCDIFYLQQVKAFEIDLLKRAGKL